MSKQKRKRQQKRQSLRHKRYLVPVLITGALLITFGAGVVLGPWKSSPVARKFQSLFFTPVPTPTVQPPTNPTKEYIYVGGRLVAIEEGGCLTGYSGTPFGGTPWSIPGSVQAENFDEGGEGIGYHDVDPGVTTGTYRPGGVYIENCGNPDGGCNVGSTWPGEWLRYSINVPTPGTYNIDARVASGNGGGAKFHIEVDCSDVTGQMTVPNTGGWQTYQTVSKSGVILTAGFHVMRVVFDVAGPGGGIANFNYFSVNSATSGSAPSNLVATTVTSSTQVALTWVAPAGTIDHYEVEKSERINDVFLPLGPNPNTTSFTDTSAVSGKAYLYHVRAVFSGGGVSPYSNTDLATVLTFADDPIIRTNDSLGRPATAIRAIHLTQLHTAIDAVRFTARLNPAPWKTNPPPQSQGSILAIHYTELRDFLNPALSALGMPTLPVDSGIAANQPVKGPHVQDVRERVK